MDVADLTGSIEKGDFIEAGGYGDVYKSRFKDRRPALQVPNNYYYAPPNLAVKVIKIPSLRSEQEKKKRFKVSVGTNNAFLE